MMAQSRAESTKDAYNYGQYINQFPSNTIKAIQEYERIQKKICRRKMSIMFNEIYIYIYIYKWNLCVYIQAYSIKKVDITQGVGNRKYCLQLHLFKEISYDGVLSCLRTLSAWPSLQAVLPGTFFFFSGKSVSFHSINCFFQLMLVVTDPMSSLFVKFFFHEKMLSAHYEYFRKFPMVCTFQLPKLWW